MKKSISGIMLLLLTWSGLAVAADSAGHPEITDVKAGLQSLVQGPPDELAMFYIADWGLDLCFNDNHCGYVDNLNNSYTNPVPFYNKRNNMDGGMAMFQGNIYVDCYFRDNRATAQNPKTTAQLAQKQIWLKWHPDTKLYSQEYTGAQLALMADVLQAGQGTIKLYRGLGAAEVQLLQRLQQGDTSTLSQLLTTRIDSLFFTPDVQAAMNWSNGYYIEVTANQSMLAGSYVGIEYNYREIGIYDPQILTAAIQTMVIHPYQKPAPPPLSTSPSDGHINVDAPSTKVSL